MRLDMSRAPIMRMPMTTVTAVSTAITVFKSCDEWIDECMKRFSCKAYVFVVDSTKKYKQYVTETLHNSSHFSKSKEYVVVIK